MLRPQAFGGLPPVIKNLIIINGLMLLAKYVLLSSYGVGLSEYLGMFFPLSENFRWYQIITHMFMHGDFLHFFFNLYAIWLFGSRLELVWGSQKLIFYYFTAGLGAAFLHELVIYIQYADVIQGMTSAEVQTVFNEGRSVIQRGMNYTDPDAGLLNSLVNVPVVGASGALFGLLLAYGMIWPNEVIYINLLFPVKVKYLVIFYGAIELWFGFSGQASGIAHFAHLGGMLFGYLLIRYWKSKGRLYH